MLHANRHQKQTLTQQQRNKCRKRATPTQLSFLRKTFMENPKPDQATREYIGRLIDMTPRSVQIWFQNNRAKLRSQEKRNSLRRHLPLTTTSCGGNVSRVHVDYEFLRKQQAQLAHHAAEYPFKFADHAPSGYAFGTGISEPFNPLIGSEAIDPLLNSPVEVYTPRSIGSRDDPAGLYGGESSPRDGVFEAFSGSKRFDAEQILHSSVEESRGLRESGSLASPCATQSNCSLEPYTKPLTVVPYEVWALKIGQWSFETKAGESYSLELSQTSLKHRIVLDFRFVSDEDEMAGYKGLIIFIEAEFTKIYKRDDWCLELAAEELPAVYALDLQGQTHECSPEYAVNELFFADQYVLYGNFCPLDADALADSSDARGSASKRMSSDSLERLMMDE